MRQAVQIELDPRTVDALAELLQRHLEAIVGYGDQLALAEQVWCVHLVGLLLDGRIPERMRRHRQVVLDIAKEILPSELYEQALACRRLNSPSGSASTSVPTPGGNGVK